MANISITTSRKTDDNGFAEILFAVFPCRGKLFRLKTGIRVPVDIYNGGDWKLPRKDMALRKKAIDLQNEIEQLKSRIFEGLLNVDPATVTKEILEQIAFPERHTQKAMDKQRNDDLLLPCLTEFIDKNKSTESTKEGYRVLYRLLARYQRYCLSKQPQGFLYCSTLDEATLKELDYYIRNEKAIALENPDIFTDMDGQKTELKRIPAKRSDNYITKLYTRLRTFVGWLKKEGHLDRDPFEKYTDNTQEKYGDPIILTREERENILKAPMPTSRMTEIRDIFIFQCLIGCRVSDMVKLTKNNIVDGCVEYIPQKTLNKKTKTIRVPLHDTALALIRKYKGRDPHGRLFPFISDVQYNKGIKEVLQAAGINRMVTLMDKTTQEIVSRPLWETASSHLARRTFISVLINAGVHPEFVKEMSGHTEDSRAFKRYVTINKETLKSLIIHL